MSSVSPTHQDLFNDTTFSQIKSCFPFPLNRGIALYSTIVFSLGQLLPAACPGVGGIFLPWGKGLTLHFPFSCLIWIPIWGWKRVWGPIQQDIYFRGFTFLITSPHHFIHSFISLHLFRFLFRFKKSDADQI